MCRKYQVWPTVHLFFIVCNSIFKCLRIRPGGIPARSEKGERLLLFIGIIDILQSYRLKKKLEHTFKSIITDGVNINPHSVQLISQKYNWWHSSILWFRLQDSVSVCRPSFYAQRFQDFMAKTVFKKIPSRKFPIANSWQIAHPGANSDCNFLRKFIFEKQRNF